jgi:2-oxoacid:acceptor oxidoreductase gamma subunit (pyruvate/2-ketoisovalerate family)
MEEGRRSRASLDDLERVLREEVRSGGSAAPAGALNFQLHVEKGVAPMIEIRFHGRGGQGTVIASEILASAFFKEGSHVQAFPTFGVERRGAPVAAFLRIDDRPIRLRCQIQEPDHVIILDPTLIPVVDVSAGLEANGWILINTDRAPQHFSRFSAGGWRVAVVDASSIALEYHLGNRTNPIVNTAILGAFASVTRLVGVDPVLQAIREIVPARINDNVRAARAAADAVRAIALEEIGS